MVWKPRVGDRRLRPRFDVVGPLQGTATVTEHVVLRDVSPRGVRFESSHPVVPGAIVEARVENAGQAVETTLQVRHVRLASGASDVYIVGAEMIGPDEAALESAAELLTADSGDRS
jgi:hypothetical protein